MLLISNKNHTATLLSGISLGSAVYSDWPYLNAKIRINLYNCKFLKKKVKSLFLQNIDLSGEVWKCISQNHVPLYHDSPQMPMYMRVEAWYMMLLHVPYMYHSWHQRNKKTAENLQISEKVLIFAARMRVAYRRDYIKLRNRSFIQSRWSSTCGFSF